MYSYNLLFPVLLLPSACLTLAFLLPCADGPPHTFILFFSWPPLAILCSFPAFPWPSPVLFLPSFDLLFNPLSCSVLFQYRHLSTVLVPLCPSTVLAPFSKYCSSTVVPGTIVIVTFAERVMTSYVITGRAQVECRAEISW